MDESCSACCQLITFLFDTMFFNHVGLIPFDFLFILRESMTCIGLVVPYFNALY